MRSAKEACAFFKIKKMKKRFFTRYWVFKGSDAAAIKKA
jgi:hypothetical protein